MKPNRLGATIGVLQIEEAVTYLRVFHYGSVGTSYRLKAQWANVSDNAVRAKEASINSQLFELFRSSLCSSGFGGGIVLVLSIAVLVLEALFRYSVRSLNQSREHRYDSLQVAFCKAIRIIINRIANLQDIMDGSTFKDRPTSDFKESIPVLETLFAIAFGGVWRNRLRCPQPLVSSLPVDTIERSCNLIREGNIVNRMTINVESFMVKVLPSHKSWFRLQF